MLGPAWLKALLDGLPKPSEQRSDLVAVVLIHTLFMGGNGVLAGIVLTQVLALRPELPQRQPPTATVVSCPILKPHRHEELPQRGRQGDMALPTIQEEVS